MYGISLLWASYYWRIGEGLAQQIVQEEQPNIPLLKKEVVGGREKIPMLWEEAEKYDEQEDQDLFSLQQ